jgi:hypothetical protein
LIPSNGSEAKSPISGKSLFSGGTTVSTVYTKSDESGGECRFSR